ARWPACRRSSRALLRERPMPKTLRRRPRPPPTARTPQSQRLATLPSWRNRPPTRPRPRLNPLPTPRTPRRQAQSRPVRRGGAEGRIVQGRATKGRLFLGMAFAMHRRLIGRPLLATLFLVATSLSQARAVDMTILNVSYDPTREFYAAFNKVFAEHWQEATGEEITIEQSHGGSGAQARAVMNGLDADVVTLGIASDIDALVNAGLIGKNWKSRL